jgi:hypothetical protein
MTDRPSIDPPGGCRVHTDIPDRGFAERIDQRTACSISKRRKESPSAPVMFVPFVTDGRVAGEAEAREDGESSSAFAVGAENTTKLRSRKAVSLFLQPSEPAAGLLRLSVCCKSASLGRSGYVSIGV